MLHESLPASFSIPHTSVEGTDSTDIVVFDAEEYAVIDQTIKNLQGYAPDVLTNITNSINNLQQIAIAVSRYPSIKRSTVLVGEHRSAQTLVNMLCNENGTTFD